MSTSVTPLEAAWEAQQGLGRLKPGWSLGPLPSMPLNSTSSHHCLPVCLISALCLCLAPPPPSLWNCGSPVLLPANSVLTEFALNHTTGMAAMLGQGRQVMGLDHVLHHTFGLKKAPPLRAFLRSHVVQHCPSLYFSPPLHPISIIGLTREEGGKDRGDQALVTRWKKTDGLQLPPAHTTLAVSLPCLPTLSTVGTHGLMQAERLAASWAFADPAGCRGVLQRKPCPDSASRGIHFLQTASFSASKRFWHRILSLPDVTTRGWHCHVLSPAMNPYG